MKLKVAFCPSRFFQVCALWCLVDYFLYELFQQTPPHYHWTSELSILNSFIHLLVSLMTGPKPLPKRAVHIVRSRASSFKWEYPLLCLRSSSSFLHLLPHLPVTSPKLYAHKLNLKIIVVCFLLCNSPVSEFYMPTFRNTLSVPSS